MVCPVFSIKYTEEHIKPAFLCEKYKKL
ncbi:hypothetical protein CALK_1137 [Chitinivibrio alkaliphilus ACht1]|uniref:Uncharacterized protein n=1 Tax=Chitinivibrio alkaliphilus ACht1 TaxID=1313304 RepID=U7D5Y1_9BACT|nr:hypothetical protein CALK_1137 [Chitinivibrio alkaliphilus ACht1]